MLRWLKRIVTLLVILALLAGNVLSLTSSSFNALLSGILAGVTGIQTLSHLNAQRLDRQRNAVKQMGSRISDRTKKIAARTTSSSALKWVPILSASIAVGLTVWELSDLCENLKDLDELYREMDLPPESDREICTAD